MKILAWCLLLAGCTTQAGDDYPVQVGGGAIPPSAGAPGMLSGRACLVSDPRELGGAAGLAVPAGAPPTPTAADGSFTLPVSATGGLPPAISIVGPGMTPTQMP